MSLAVDTAVPIDGDAVRDLSPKGRLRLPASVPVQAGYLAFLIAGLLFVHLYGFLASDVAPREGTWLLRFATPLSAARDAGISPLALGRSLSLVVTTATFAYCLVIVRRRIGWYGLGVLATVLACSPIFATMTTSATPDALLFATLVLPIFPWWASRMASRADSPTMGRWCAVGMILLLALGLAGMADILCGRGKIENVFTNNDPFRIGLSMIITGSAIFTLLVGTSLAAVGQRWALREVSTGSARWWTRGLAFLSIRVPLAALVLVIYRMLTVYSAMERVHIITACAWIALILAIVQVRLRHWEGQFFPILLVALALKIVWVHALSRERDIERGSAIFARAVANSMPSGASLETGVPVDPVFAYTLWAEAHAVRPRDPAGHFVLERIPSTIPNSVVGRFQDPHGGDVYLVRRDDLARTAHSLGPLLR
ncbi:hypothetical protein K2X85_14555 [bacterium]|nr:hypothetical protein [bacterium]